jgi:hypothetical protein
MIPSKYATDLSFTGKRSKTKSAPKNALPLLGMKNLLPERVFKYQLVGNDYELCNDILKLFGKEMEGHGFEDVVLLDVCDIIIVQQHRDKIYLTKDVQDDKGFDQWRMRKRA